MTMKHLLLIALLCGCTQRNDETNSRAQSATIPNARQETMLQADASEGAGKTPGFAWQAAAWQEHSRNHAFAIATLFGAAIALILVNTMLTLTMSYTTMLAYLSGALFYLLFMMDLTGVVPLLPSPWEAIFARALPVWGALMVTCMVWFSVRFLGITREIYPRTIALCNLYYVAATAFIIGTYFADPRWSFYCYLPLSFLVIIVLAGVIRKEMTIRRNKYAVYYLISFVPPIAVGLFEGFAVFGVFDETSLHPTLQLTAGVVNSIVLSIALAFKCSETRARHERIKSSLKGVIADAQIERVSNEGIHILHRPIEQEVTVVFVDIVSYSMISRRMEGFQAFQSLKNILSELAAIVHHHGGVIDKSLGDGILCFFGYDLTGRPNQEHPLQAYRCALALQEHALQVTLKNAESNKQVFPLQIGINTASVYIGNMGDESRLDVTISGDGVVLANRFETACEPYKIIIGSSTYELLSQSNELDLHVNRILIPIKHMKTLMEAWECDPFLTRVEELQKARAIFWQAYQIQRGDDRQQVGTPLSFGTSFGDMTMVNFSNGGFCLDGQVFLGKGASFELKLDILMNDRILKIVSPLTVEVAWSMVNADGSYRHGVRIIGANAGQRKLVYDLLTAKIMERLQAQQFIA